MSPEQVEVLILGSGQSGKLLAWQMARSGRRTTVVERRWVGGSCPNIACMPSKNEVWSARVAYLAQHAGQFGTIAGPVETDMAAVLQRKRDMVNREIELHLQNFRASGAELIMGSGRFVAPKTLEVHLDDGGLRRLIASACVSQRRDARGRPGDSGSQSGAAADPYRGARTRPPAAAPDRAGEWLRRAGDGAGLSPVRQPGDHDRGRPTHPGPGGP